METVKGFRDKIGKDAEKAAFIREVARQTFERYNFFEVETPIIEYEEFVKGENQNDEAVSDIFKLNDKGGRNLALRYEFTFQLKRIAKNQKLPFKRFQIGPVFRDEPVTGNRFRQFTQCDIDVVGATIKDQAEFLCAINEILVALKINSTIYVNNRKLLNEILDEEKIKNKEEVIRELDKMDKLSESEVLGNFKRISAEKILEVIKKPEAFFKKYKSYSEIEELKKYAKLYGVEVKFLPSLARGLSYYTGNVFEVKSKIKETICAGGTYLIDGVESSGISFSIERFMAVTNVKLNIEKILVVSLNEDKKAIELSKKLRKMGKNASVYFGKPTKALEYANSYGIKKVIFIGKKEVEKKKMKIKNLMTGKEVTLTIERIDKGKF
ncbi:MAG: ATP phosphoribosyltransferase regulatory subunit [Nanoarchaeota archaeon]|nr:ATP phosphoribosyltransferase regulatory subunit [Nanoarchaeota archaeon]